MPYQTFNTMVFSKFFNISSFILNYNRYQTKILQNIFIKVGFIQQNLMYQIFIRLNITSNRFEGYV
jgi:hypothetical protein